MKKKYQTVDADQVRFLRSEGMSYAEIQKRLNTTYRDVRSILTGNKNETILTGKDIDHLKELIDNKEYDNILKEMNRTKKEIRDLLNILGWEVPKIFLGKTIKEIDEDVKNLIEKGTPICEIAKNIEAPRSTVSKSAQKYKNNYEPAKPGPGVKTSNISGNEIKKAQRELADSIKLKYQKTCKNM